MLVVMIAELPLERGVLYCKAPLREFIQCRLDQCQAWMAYFVIVA